jgi:hypothetical protein
VQPHRRLEEPAVCHDTGGRPERARTCGEIEGLLVVGPGEVVPVDGRSETAALLDESALTGEPLLVERPAGDPGA